MAQPRARRLPALDALRAVAVGTVIAYHAGMWGVPADLGVSAFFVLSGFLITWLLLREFEGSGDASLRRFYLRRTLRIFPAYYVFLLLSYAVDHSRGGSWGRGLTLSAVGYAVNYFNALHGEPITSITHAWSLAVEEQFYLLWPLIFLLLMRRGAHRAVVALCTGIVAVVAWRSWLYLDVGTGSPYVNNAFDTRFDNLAVGCLTALCVGRPVFERFAQAAARTPLAPLATIALLAVSRILSAKAYHYSVGYTVDAILLAILVLQLLQLSGSALWAWLDWRPVRYLGALSYSLYLYHNWGLTAGQHVPGPPVLKLAGGVGAALLLAAGSYHGIERPFLRLRDRLERRWWPSRPGADTAPTLPSTKPMLTA